MSEANIVVESLFTGILKDTMWTILREAINPLTKLVGFELPTVLNLSLETQQRLNTGPGYDFIKLFDYLFKDGQVGYSSIIKPIVDTIYARLSAVLPTVASLSLAIREAIRNFFANDPLIIATIVAAINQALPTALGRVSDAFSTMVSQLMLMTSEFFITTWGPTLTNTIDIIGRLGTILNEYLKPMLTMVELLVNNFAEVIAAELPTIMDTVQAAINASIANLNGFVNQTYATITNVVNTTLTQLGELEYYISTEFKFWVGEAAEYIINSLRGVETGQAQLFDWISREADHVRLDIANLAATDQAYYTDLGNRIDTGWFSFNDSLQTQLGGIWGGFQSQILEPIGAAWDGFSRGLADQFSNFFGAVACDASAVSNWFGGIFNQLSTWIQSLCGSNCQHDIATNLPDPFGLITRSLTSVLGVGGGLGLSMTLGEFVHPLKSLGLSRLAAYFWDMADFKSVGGDVLKQLNFASTLSPLKYGLNEFFRPYLPKTEDANRWLHKRLIELPEWRQFYARHGFPDAYIDQFQAEVWTEPSDRMLIALAETPGVPDGWLEDKVRRRGYDDVDNLLFRNYITKRRLSDEFGRLISAYRAAFIKGYVDYEQFGAIIKATGRSELEYAWMLESANRERDTKRLDEDVTEYIQAFRTDKLDLDQFSAGIYALPLVPERAKNLIDLELARKKTRTVTGNAAKQAKLSVPQIMKGFDFGWFSDDDVVTRLQLLDYNLEDSMLILAIHKGDIAAREADTTQAAQLKAERDAVAEESRLAIEWARFLLAAISYRQLSAQVVKDMILELPLSDARKELFYNEADLIASRPAQEGTAAKPKTLRETDVYKALFNNLITYDDAINYLVNKGYTQEQAFLLLQLNAPDYLPPA